MNDARWLCIVTWVVRGCIIGLAATCFLGVLGGGLDMWPDVDHLPSYTAILFPAVYGDLAQYPPRFLHLVFFRIIVAANIIMAAFTCGCTVAIIREIRA